METDGGAGSEVFAALRRALGENWPGVHTRGRWHPVTVSWPCAKDGA